MFSNKINYKKKVNSNNNINMINTISYNIPSKNICCFKLNVMNVQHSILYTSVLK